MTKLLKLDWFIKSLAIFSGLEIWSLWCYQLDWLNWSSLIAIVAVAGWLVWRDFRWSIFLLAGEVFWGSLGRSFYWELAGFDLSVRMVIFALVVLIWLIKYRSSWKKLKWSGWNLRSTVLALGFVLLGIMIGLGHNSWSATWTDANGWLFLIFYLLWLPFFELEIMPKLVALLAAAVVVISLKTLLLVNLFANDYAWANVGYWYLWVRDTKVGELTYITEGFWRVFLQSQLYAVIIWLAVSLAGFLRLLAIKKGPLLLGALAFSTVLSSQSRSFWLVGGLTLIVSFILMCWPKKRQLAWSRGLAVFCGSLLGGLLLFTLALTVPSGRINIRDIFTTRLSQTASSSARLNQLAVLLPGWRQNWLIGAGFGSSLTYLNPDPRQLTYQNRNGEYTTFSFELGWLD